MGSEPRSGPRLRDTWARRRHGGPRFALREAEQGRRDATRGLGAQGGLGVTEEARTHRGGRGAQGEAGAQRKGRSAEERPGRRGDVGA